MKETPIIMSMPMVQAILEGRKTQTRRIIKPQPNENGIEYIPVAPALDWEEYYNDEWKPWHWETEQGESIMKFCPFGEEGDLLWVRETFCKNENPDSKNFNGFEYLADYAGASCRYLITWKPSIHMPKKAARIWLKIKDVRVERLKDISKADAIAEGILSEPTGDDFYKNYGDGFHWIKAKKSFQSLWQSINGEESWEANPWVWCLTFQRVIYGK